MRNAITLALPLASIASIVYYVSGFAAQIVDQMP